MKLQRVLGVLVVLCVCAVPCMAQDAADDVADDAPAQPQAEALNKAALFGAWYPQLRDGTVLPGDGENYLVFGEDGIARTFGREQGRWFYDLDEAAETLTIYDQHADGDESIEDGVTMRCRVVDGVLELAPPGEAFGGEHSMELTRNPQGTERHQQLRAAQGAPRGEEPAVNAARRMQSVSVALASWMADHDGVFPERLSDVWPEYLSDEGLLFTYWSRPEMPDNFDELELEAQRDWLDANTSFAYFASGQSFAAIPQIQHFAVLLAIPAEEHDQATVVYADGHIESHLAEDADELIRQQTGHRITDWANAESRGSGRVAGDDQADRE